MNDQAVFDRLPEWDRTKSRRRTAGLQRRLGNAPVQMLEDKRPASEIIGDNLPF
jgi:hypothetical protein